MPPKKQSSAKQDAIRTRNRMQHELDNHWTMLTEMVVDQAQGSQQGMLDVSHSLGRLESRLMEEGLSGNLEGEPLLENLLFLTAVRQLFMALIDRMLDSEKEEEA
jgi:hypothetical protein